LEISLANFTVNAGDNHIHRKVANGVVEDGWLKGGSVKQTNITFNTESKTLNVTKGMEPMVISY